MAAPRTPGNLYVRRSYLQRIRDALRNSLRLPGQGVQIFRRWPKRFRYLFAILAALTFGFAAFAGGRYYLKRVDDKAVERLKSDLDAEVRKTHLDRDKCAAIIAKILDVEPNEAWTLSRKKALETGRGDPADAVMMQCLFRDFIHHNQPDDLLRESRNRLKHEPHDYEAHFYCAKTLLDKGDAATAEPHLVAMGDPELNRVNLGFGVAAGGIQLLNEKNRDIAKMRSFIADNIGQFLKSEGIAESDPNTQAMVLFLYSETFALPSLRPDAALIWPFAARLMDKCFDGAKTAGAVPVVRNLGGLSPRYVAALSQMKAANQLSEPQRAEYAKELEARIQRAWNYVLLKDPKNAEAYVGLIDSYFRSGENRKAVDTMLAGLEASGDNPHLLSIFSKLSILNYREMLAYERLVEAAERNPKVPFYWLLAAQTAAAADRRDLANAALDKARKVMPKAPDILIMQAELNTGTGYPEVVLACLAAIPDAEWVRMTPRACTVLVRAVAEIGDGERLDYVLEEAKTLGVKQDSPQPAYFAALGLHEAVPPTIARADRTAEYLQPVVQRQGWRLKLKEASQLYADALVRAVVLKPGPFDPVASRNAIIACERALTLDGNHVPTVTNLLFLRLRVDDNPGKALDDIGPLLAKIDSLTPEQVEVLAMVYNGNKRYDDAIRVILTATTARKTAGCWIQLAIAYHGQGRADDAENALRSATQLPMTDRERADYDGARDLLSRVKP